MANKEERIVAVAALQFACTDDVDTNVAKAEKWVVLPLPQFHFGRRSSVFICLESGAHQEDNISEQLFFFFGGVQIFLIET
jgi:hypothetical protein